MEGVSQILIRLARDGRLSVKAKDIQGCLERLLKDGAIARPRDIFSPEGWGACTQALAEHAMATKSAKHLKVWGVILQSLKRGMEEKETIWAARKALGIDCQGCFPLTEEQETQVEKREVDIENKGRGSDDEVLTAQERTTEGKRVEEGVVAKAYPVTGKGLHPPQYPWDELRVAECKAQPTQPAPESAPKPAPLPSVPPQFVGPEEWLPGLAMKAPEDPLELAAELASPGAGYTVGSQKWREREVPHPKKGNQWRDPDRHPDIAEDVEELTEQLAAVWGEEDKKNHRNVEDVEMESLKPGRPKGASRAEKVQIKDHNVQMNLQQLQQLIKEIVAEVDKQKKLIRTRATSPPPKRTCPG